VLEGRHLDADAAADLLKLTWTTIESELFLVEPDAVNGSPPPERMR